MPYPLKSTRSSEPSAHTEAPQERFSLRESQTIVYDAHAVNAAIVIAIGPEPASGAPNAQAWRRQQDRLFNHELDVLRTASGASAGQTITFEPIHEPEHLG